MIKKYTIKDIAELAGVSKGTVDRVLHKRGKVSKSAFIKVNEVLTRIEFKPNPIAKNLKNNKLYKICVLMPDPVEDPYWNPCISGINEAIAEYEAFGIYVESVFFNPANSKSFIRASDEIIKKAPDAVLLVPLFYKESHTIIQEYKSQNIIVSTFNNTMESTYVKNFIGQDLFQSGRVAAKLLDCITNHGDIFIIHINDKYKNSIFMQEKEKGFRSYFEQFNSKNHSIEKLKIKYSKCEEKIVNLVKTTPNLAGIFVTTSKTYQVANVIENRLSKKIPIVGYDLLDENIFHLKKGTIDFIIHQHPKQQAYLGLKFLVEHFLFDKIIPKQLLLPIDIINSENILYSLND